MNTATIDLSNMKLSQSEILSNAAVLIRQRRLTQSDYQTAFRIARKFFVFSLIFPVSGKADCIFQTLRSYRGKQSPGSILHYKIARKHFFRPVKLP